MHEIQSPFSNNRPQRFLCFASEGDTCIIETNFMIISNNQHIQRLITRVRAGVAKKIAFATVVTNYHDAMALFAHTTQAVAQLLWVFLLSFCCALICVCVCVCTIRVF